VDTIFDLSFSDSVEPHLSWLSLQQDPFRLALRLPSSQLALFPSPEPLINHPFHCNGLLTMRTTTLATALASAVLFAASHWTGAEAGFYGALLFVVRMLCCDGLLTLYAVYVGFSVPSTMRGDAAASRYGEPRRLPLPWQRYASR
jgi:hypothetical protein